MRAYKIGIGEHDQARLYNILTKTDEPPSDGWHLSRVGGGGLIPLKMSVPDCTISPLSLSPFRWSENQYRFTSLPSPPIHKGLPIDEYGSNAPPLTLPAAQARAPSSDSSSRSGAVLRTRSSAALDEIIQSGFDEMDRVLASRRSNSPRRSDHTPATSSTYGLSVRPSGVSVLMHGLECSGRGSDPSSPSAAHSDASASIGVTRRGSMKRTSSHLNVDAPCFVPRFAPHAQAGAGSTAGGRTTAGSSERLPRALGASAALLRGAYSPAEQSHSSDTSMHWEAHAMAPTEEEQEWLDRQVSASPGCTAQCSHF